jgi:hypothetical protein
MTCLAGSAGYERYREAVDMAVELSRADLGTGPAQGALASAGIEVRRAAVADAQAIGQWRSGAVIRPDGRRPDRTGLLALPEGGVTWRPGL